MRKYALYPKETISHERFLEMRQFCVDTFGGWHSWKWVASANYHTFSFSSETDLLVFYMAYPHG
jgi:hypothetical protein